MKRSVSQAVREDKKPFSTSLDRALEIFSCIARSPNGLTNAQLARRLQIPTSSCSYILHRLEHAGYMRREEESREYKLGIKVLSLAHSVLYEMGVYPFVRPILEEIAQATRQLAIVAILHDGYITILCKCGMSNLVKVDFEMGARYPAHATAIGKMLLAKLPCEDLEDFFKRHALIQHSPSTIASKDRLQYELDSIRGRGYSTSNGELYLGIRGLAVPIPGVAGDTIAGLTVAGPRLDLDNEEVLKVISSGAARISHRLQWVAAARQTTATPIT